MLRAKNLLQVSAITSLLLILVVSAIPQVSADVSDDNPPSAQVTYSVTQLASIYTYTLNVVNTSPAPYEMYVFVFACQGYVEPPNPALLQNVVPVSSPSGWTLDNITPACIRYVTSTYSANILAGQSGTFVFTSTTAPPSSIPFVAAFLDIADLAFDYSFNGVATYDPRTSAQVTYSVTQLASIYTYTLNVVNTSPAPYDRLYRLLFGCQFGVPIPTTALLENVVPVSSPSGWTPLVGAVCIQYHFEGAASGYIPAGQSGTFVFTSTTAPPSSIPFGVLFTKPEVGGIAFDGFATLSGSVVVLTPQQATESLGGQVQSLGAPGGPLNSGQVNSLLAKLNNAIAKLNSGQVNAGCNLLNSFINEVQALVSSGVLTAVQGNPLISQAQTIRNAVPC